MYGLWGLLGRGYEFVKSDFRIWGQPCHVSEEMKSCHREKRDNDVGKEAAKERKIGLKSSSKEHKHTHAAFQFGTCVLPILVRHFVNGDVFWNRKRNTNDDNALFNHHVFGEKMTIFRPSCTFTRRFFASKWTQYDPKPGAWRKVDCQRVSVGRSAECRGSPVGGRVTTRQCWGDSLRHLFAYTWMTISWLEHEKRQDSL